MSTPAYAIVLDRGSPEEREALQAIVLDNVEQGWWHHFADLWIVRGKTASEWRDLARPALQPAQPSSIMVLKIDTDDSRTWSYYGKQAEKRNQWLHKHLVRWR